MSDSVECLVEDYVLKSVSTQTELHNLTKGVQFENGFSVNVALELCYQNFFTIMLVIVSV